MTTLADLLLAPARRDALTADLVALVEQHVRERPGLRGAALRAAFAAVRRALPDAVPRTVTRLLPDLAAALGQGRPLTVATIMGIAEARVERSRHAAVKSFYAGFRGIAEREAADFVPGLAAVLARHLA